MVNPYPELTIRHYRPGDETRILATFNRVFREVNGPEFVDRTLEQWWWQYRDNPVGWRITLAVAEDGTIASQYAGVPLRAHTRHGEQTFIHCVDSFTHPDYRKGLKRPGIFVVTGRAFTAHLREIGDAVAYGYPVPMAERIGRRFLEYHFMRVVDYLCRDLAGDGPAAPAGIEVERVADVPAEVDGLCRRAAADKECWLVRDHSYLDWRYVRIPGDDYELYAARRDGELAGLLVLRPEHGLIPDACTVADWLVPAGDDEITDALLARAAERGRERGRRTLLAVFADPSVEHAAFVARGFRVEPSSQWLERRLVYLITGSPMTEEFLRDHWWYTLGDSDLV